MALFKINKGLKENLPATKTEGYCWYTTDDSLFYIDYVNESGVLTRKALNAKDAETLTGASLSTILKSSDIEIPTSKAVLDAIEALETAIDGKAPSSHTHDNRYYTETEIDTKLADKSDTTHKHDNLYDVKGSASAVQSNLDALSDELDTHTGNSNIHFTSAERTKLSGVETGAQKNTITGVKGNSESSYRTGNVNITPANIGLGNVNNTSDASKPVSTAQQTAIDNALASAKSYADTKTSGLASSSSVSTSIGTHNTSASAHEDIRSLIDDLSAAVNKFLDVDDTTTDQLSEVLTLIENNKGTLESLTSSKINVSDIVNNLTTNNSSKVLSAAQGVAIKTLIDALQEVADGKADEKHSHVISDVTNLQTTLNEKVPTSRTINGKALTGNITLSASDVSAAASSHTHDDIYYTETEVDTLLSKKSDTSHTHSNYVQTSRTINGKALSSNITLSASDVGALPSTTSIPDSLSDLTADSTHRTVTDVEKAAWDAKSDFSGSYNDLTDKPSIPSISGLATEAYVDTAANTKVDKISGKGLSTNDYTTTEKNKLSGIAAGAEVNQNAFSNVVVGSTTIAADSKTDSLTIAAGTGISVSGDATNDKVTITNTGVRSIGTGTSNGTISVNTNGTSTDVAVKGLGSAAYTASTAYDAAGTAQTKADSALASAKSYTDGKISALLDGADDTTLDSIKELANAIKTNDSAIDALNDIAAGKANATHSHAIADVSGLQSALDGKAASSHGTHVSYSSTAPVMDGTASAGGAGTVARSDHKHPTDTSRASKTEFDTHVADKTIHITSTERTNWNAAKTHAGSAHAPSNAEKNQNAFSNVTVGSTTIAADTATDTLTLVAGSNVTITPDATNDKITISATDTNTTYSAGAGISLSGTTFSNSGVRSIAAGSANGTISVNTNGTSADVAVKGLGSAAYKATSAFDAAGAADTALTNAKAYTDEVASGKANSSHGNHVPTTQTASNKVFLRNDNTWATVTPANIGAAASSHTHTVANITDLTATATELNYVDGVTSSIQTQLNAKVPTSRTVNGKALSSNITLSASDVSAYTKAEIDAMVFITVDDIDAICEA